MSTCAYWRTCQPGGGAAGWWACHPALAQRGFHRTGSARFSSNLSSRCGSLVLVVDMTGESSREQYLKIKAYDYHEHPQMTMTWRSVESLPIDTNACIAWNILNPDTGSEWYYLCATSHVHTCTRVTFPVCSVYKLANHFERPHMKDKATWCARD